MKLLKLTLRVPMVVRGASCPFYVAAKEGLEALGPLIPLRAMVVSDQHNPKMFPGEATAVEEVLGLKNNKIERVV